MAEQTPLLFCLLGPSSNGTIYFSLEEGLFLYQGFNDISEKRILFKLEEVL